MVPTDDRKAPVMRVVVHQGAHRSYDGAAENFEIFNAARLQHLRLFVVGDVPMTCQGAVQILSTKCLLVHTVDRMGDVDLILKRNNLSEGLLVIVHTDSASAVFEDLVMFRSLAPAAAVVLAASDLRAHDLSLERGKICDASLCSPYSVVALALGVQSALNNSREIRDRGMYQWADPKVTTTTGRA